jgi:hypothetical protein
MISKPEVKEIVKCLICESFNQRDRAKILDKKEIDSNQLTNTVRAWYKRKSGVRVTYICTIINFLLNFNISKNKSYFSMTLLNR